MLGWTNSNVVCMEFTYSLNVSSSNYYPPPKKQTNKQTHTKTPQKLPPKNPPKTIKTVNMQNIFIIINLYLSEIYFFSSEDLHTVALKPDTIKHITSKEEWLLSL